MSNKDEEMVLTLNLKAKGKKKSGLEVELRNDGHYYVSRTPKGATGISVGDRVLHINGVNATNFKSEHHANDVIDTFQLEM